MVSGYYVNEAVRKMYGIPLSQLTPEQREILRQDGIRRAKLIDERQKDFMRNNKRAFEDAEKLNKVLASIYGSCQKEILGNVAETIAKVKKAGGEWSYANQSALTRSRGLFEQINKELIKLGKEENTVFRTNLQNIYTDQFLRTVYTLGQTQTVKSSFNMLNPRLIQDTLDYPWSGAMFSDRLWLDKDRLGRNLRVGLTQSMILGEDMDRIADRVGANINTSKYNAMRVARTETKRVTYSSQAAAFEDQSVGEVRYMAANNGGDSRTCDLCREDHGKVYKLGEEPSLPRHPNCRCWYIPVVKDTFEDNELNELTGSVRGAENYEKWKEKEVARIKAAQELADKEKSPQDLITAKVMDDMKRAQEERKVLSLQIDSLENERSKIPSQYTKTLSDLELKKGHYHDIINKKADEIDTLNAEMLEISKRRVKAGELLDAKKISEEEYDRIADEVRKDRRLKRDVISKKLDEISEMEFKIRETEQQISETKKEIQKKQAEITDKIQKLNDAIMLSMNSEKDLYLDISYVGDSMERYNNVDLFRSLREGHRSIKTFDMETYKDELTQMAQRMDKDALTIQKKLSHLLQKNEYSQKKSGRYSPMEKKIHMDMDSNTHERALKNGLRGSWQTKFHEEGHQLDHILSSVEKIAGSDAFGYAFTSSRYPTGKKIQAAIEKDLVSFLNKAVKYSNEKEGQSYKPVKGLSRIASDTRFAFTRYMIHLTSGGMDSVASCQLGVLTDAIGLYTKDRLGRNQLGFGWGHDSSYNKQTGIDGSSSETWATFCALRVCGSKEEVEMMKKVMPETWKCMDGIYHDIAVYLEDHELEYGR